MKKARSSKFKTELKTYSEVQLYLLEEKEKKPYYRELSYDLRRAIHELNFEEAEEIVTRLEKSQPLIANKIREKIALLQFIELIESQL